MTVTRVRTQLRGEDTSSGIRSRFGYINEPFYFLEYHISQKDLKKGCPVNFCQGLVNSRRCG